MLPHGHKDLFLNRFTDGRDQFKHKIDAKYAARQDDELIKKLLPQN